MHPQAFSTIHGNECELKTISQSRKRKYTNNRDTDFKLKTNMRACFEYYG